MGLIDRFKKMIDERKKEKLYYEMAARAEANMVNNDIPENIHYVLNRNYIDLEGESRTSDITLSRKVDEKGYPIQINVNGQKIQVWNLSAPEIQDSNGIRGVDLYADLDENKMKSDRLYRNAITSNLLSIKNLTRIYEENGGYAGGINVGYGVQIDPNILEAIRNGVDKNGNPLRVEYTKTDCFSKELLEGASIMSMTGTKNNRNNNRQPIWEYEEGDKG